MFMDVTTDFGGGYTPTDADLLERGPVRLREAIQVSLNIPAIKAAIEIGRIACSSAHGNSGSSTRPHEHGRLVDRDRTLEVHMIDLISAYGAIANGGVLVPRTTISRCVTPQPDDLAPAGATPQGKAVVSPQAAFVMTTSSRETRTGPEPVLEQAGDLRRRHPATGHPEDGTDERYEGLTAMGYLAPPTDPQAPAFVVGAWMGNSDNSAPPAAWSRSRPRLAMAVVPHGGHEGQPIADFEPPPGVAQTTVDAFTGMLPARSRRRRSRSGSSTGRHRPRSTTRRSRPGRLGDRQAVAAGCQARRRRRLPRPEQRRGRLPAWKPFTALDRAGPEGARRAGGRRRPGRATSTRTASGPIRAELGAHSRHRDVRHRRPSPEPSAAPSPSFDPFASPFRALPPVGVDPAQPAAATATATERSWEATPSP